MHLLFFCRKNVDFRGTDKSVPYKRLYRLIFPVGRPAECKQQHAAIQMDIKIDGLTYDIIAEAFEKCRKGRLYILDEIIKPVIAEPRHLPSAALRWL